MCPFFVCQKEKKEEFKQKSQMTHAHKQKEANKYKWEETQPTTTKNPSDDNWNDSE